MDGAIGAITLEMMCSEQRASPRYSVAERADRALPVGNPIIVP